MAGYKRCLGPDCEELLPRNSAKIYCSTKCRQAAFRKRKARTTGRNIATYGVSRCASCGREYWKRHPSQRFCSGACKQRVYRELKKLESE